MCHLTVNKKETIIIFFPFEINNVHRSYLYGDVETFNEFVKIFFATKILHVDPSKGNEDIFGNSNPNFTLEQNKLLNDWLFIEIKSATLSIGKMKVDGEFKNLNQYHFLWISYNFKLFSLSEFSSSKAVNMHGEESYFKHLKDKINEKVNIEKKKQPHRFGRIANIMLSFLSAIILRLSLWSEKLLPVTKYFNIAIHINNYLSAFLWAVKSTKEKKKIDIKVTNFLLSMLLDMILGILFLNWLSSKVSLDSSATFFLLTAESVVNSIKNLINWLRGDPAGLKLNWAFNKILAMFFLFHIEVWWTFLVYLKPAVKIIFQIFLKLGLLGITFQASITADLLALVSFHVYCIHAYAAKLYSIQISTLISLWRLFLGRKKNPLRRKVDSCRYSPKQLFVGTLVFTILLFLLPTTLLYYVVFTTIKLLILIIGAILMFIQYFSQSLPVYTTILWILRSPKVFAGIEIERYNDIAAGDFILLKVKPGMCSWWETVSHFTPDCALRPSKFNPSAFFNSLITGKHISPLAQQ